MNAVAKYGHYFLLGRLNTGGMAEVFLAKSANRFLEGRLLALKRILPAYSSDTEFVAMFADEARILSQLHHPNICEIYDHGQIEDQLYLSMEFVHGKDLHVLRSSATKQKQRVPFATSVAMIAQVAYALHFAHNQRNAAGEPLGIVHRDVCPSNILVSYDGRPLLIDFGIAKADERVAETRAGLVKGKTPYMSPEQVRGQPLNHLTDIYSLGLVLYELLAGKPAFDSLNTYDALLRVADSDIKPLDARALDLPQTSCRIVQKVLAKDPADRYPSAKEFGDALMSVLDADTQANPEASIKRHMREFFAVDYQRDLKRLRHYETLDPETFGSLLNALDDSDNHRAHGTITEPRNVLFEAKDGARNAGLAERLEPSVPTSQQGGLDYASVEEPVVKRTLLGAGLREASELLRTDAAAFVETQDLSDLAPGFASELAAPLAESLSRDPKWHSASTRHVKQRYTYKRVRVALLLAFGALAVGIAYALAR